LEQILKPSKKDLLQRPLAAKTLLALRQATPHGHAPEHTLILIMP
jgi:hypothetical protein